MNVLSAPLSNPEAWADTIPLARNLEEIFRNGENARRAPLRSGRCGASPAPCEQSLPKFEWQLCAMPVKRENCGLTHRGRNRFSAESASCP